MSINRVSKRKVPVRSELRETLKIFLPLAAANPGQAAAVGITDNIILGHLGPDALGAAGLAFSIYNVL